MLGTYTLFLVLWGAIGIIALVGGVVVTLKAARQMEHVATEAHPAPASPDNEQEDALAA